MQATVLLNAHAGSVGDVDEAGLAAALRDAGYDPVVRRTHDLDDLDAALAGSGGLVVAVGGDGTLREAALRLRGGDRPLALVPMGTANNVAASLGLERERDPYDLLRRLRAPRRCAFDLGRVATPAGETAFLEACGFGLYAELLARYRPEAGKDVLRAVEAIGEVVRGFEPCALAVEANGERFEGPFVLATAMNTPRMGLRVPLAPDADPCDGRLDLVLIRHEDGHNLLEYGSRLLRGTLEEAVTVSRLRVRCCTIESQGGAFHVDDQVREAEGPVRIEIEAGAVELWLPEAQEA